VGRVIAVLLATAALSAGCGGSGASGDASLGSILKRPGPNVAVTAGASEFVPGNVRYPFLVIRNDAKPVERPAATVWVAKSRSQKPFARTRARLEPIGVPGRSAPAFGGVTKLYVAHLRIPRPGRYWLVALPDGARIQALGVLDVGARSSSPAVGAKAPFRRVHHNAESHRNAAFGALTKEDMLTKKDGEAYGDGFPLTVFQPDVLLDGKKPTSVYTEVCTLESYDDFKSYVTDLSKAGFYVPKNWAWDLTKSPAASWAEESGAEEE
jgi:hypothetical protein